MPEVISREHVQDLLARGAQLVDVLPHDEYVEQHIAGAISIPLKLIDSEAPLKLDRTRPVITYCWDYQ